MSRTPEPGTRRRESPIRAVGFDLGETLVGYGTVPLSWQSLYREALREVAAILGVDVSEAQVTRAEAILARYNTRLHPRTTEHTSATILGQVFDAWGWPTAADLDAAEEAFFSFFQRASAPYRDSQPTLTGLRARGLRLGVLTDVPYGMPARFVQRDVAPLEGIDVLLTSVEVGFRKPHVRGYQELLARLGVAADECLFVGNEPKDVGGAAAAGLVPVFLDREAVGASYGALHCIESLGQLPAIVDAYPDSSAAARR